MQAATADGSWMLWTAIGIGGIWIAVVLISLFAPDFVSGSEQEHTWRLPSPRGSGVASAPSRSYGRWASSAETRRGGPPGSGCRCVTLAIWTAATVIGIATPVVETGSDPHLVPVGAFFRSIAAAMLTALAGVVANVFRRSPGGE